MLQEEKASEVATKPQHGFRGWLVKHPRLVSWFVLAVGMVAMLLYASRDVGLLPGQLATLVVATILVAGLCVWIINWE